MMREVCKSWAQGFDANFVAMEAKQTVRAVDVLPQIQNFGRLERICLTGDLYGTKLEYLAGSSVRTLDLSQCKGVTEALLHSLFGCSLTSLSLYVCSEVDDISILILQMTCPSVSDLNIGGTNVGDFGLGQLWLFPLVSLHFREFPEGKVTREGIRAIRKHSLTSLELSVAGDFSDEDWEFSDTSFDFQCLQELEGLPLTHLKIEGRNESLSDEFLGFLRGMPLTTLELTQCDKISEDTFLLLFGMPLRSLCIQAFCDRDDLISRAALDILWEMPLTSLRLSGPFDFGTLNFLRGQLRSLTSLRLWSPDVQFDDGSVSNLKGMLLSDLQLDGCDGITDEGLGFLEGIPLKYLELVDCKMITDKGLAKLSSMCMGLEVLVLNRCNATEEGCEKLLTLPLNVLVLSTTSDKFYRVGDSQARRAVGCATRYCTALSIGVLMQYVTAGWFARRICKGCVHLSGIHKHDAGICCLVAVLSSWYCS